MLILGIESSCDETAAALVREGRQILSSVVASQIQVHSEYGGVVPELASREHVDNICFVVEQCLQQAAASWDSIEAVAVTRGPGLVGALLVGLAYGKSIAYALGVPFLGVNHLEGHIYSIFLDHPHAELPALSLVVSGGHTSLYYLKEMGSYRLLARTRDDAAGEAFDKLAKALGLGYPGGPVIDRLASLGNASAVFFTLPKISDQTLDFSFSGLKTAALRYLREKRIGVVDPLLLEEALREGGDCRIPSSILDLVASYQASIIDQLLDRLEKALQVHPARSIQISGGVSCNSQLRQRSGDFFQARGIPVYHPRTSLTTDNAAMIAAAAFYRLERGESDSWSLPAHPNLPLEMSGQK